MKVRVCVPTFNQAAYIEKTLRSISNQTYPNIEVLVSDDGSTDLTARILESWTGTPNWTVIRRSAPSGNLFLHWNELIRQTDAPLVTLFHSDDLFLPDMVVAQVDFFRRHPDACAVFTGAIAIDENDSELFRISAPESVFTAENKEILDPEKVFKHLLQFGNSFLVCPSVMFRREIFNEVGFFDTQLKQSSDIEMWLRLLLKSGKKVGYLNQPLMKVRYSTTQATHLYEVKRAQTREVSDFYSVLEKILPSVKCSADELQAFESLKKLDQLKLGLRLVVAGVEEEELTDLKDALTWFDHRRKNLAQFGTVDRCRIRGALFLSPFLFKPFGKIAAKWLLHQTDISRSALLRFAFRFRGSAS